jgi:hypothetical protein
MKPRIFRLGLFVLAGAIVNVAVAWGCAMWIPLYDSHLAKHDVFNDWEGTTGYSLYTVHRWCRIGAFRVEVSKTTDVGHSGMPWKTTAAFKELIPKWGLEFLHVSELSAERLGIGFEGELSLGVRSVDARGWPLLCEWGGFRPPPPQINVDQTVLCKGWLVRGVIPIERYSIATTNYHSAKSLPYLPLWPEFAINTVFYASILWMLFAGPGWIRRRVRIKRGLCPACAYSVGASDVCTECCKASGSPPRRGYGV